MPASRGRLPALKAAVLEANWAKGHSARLKDPADEMVLETAVNGAAAWLVTFNTRHLAEAAFEFGIRVLKPGEAWKELQRQNEKK